jgi:hypothetical protein
MEEFYEDFEVVHILDDCWLIDAESYQRPYHLPQTRLLQPGYYVVSWPGHGPTKRFDEQADFLGPFTPGNAWATRDRLDFDARHPK